MGNVTRHHGFALGRKRVVRSPGWAVRTIDNYSTLPDAPAKFDHTGGLDGFQMLGNGPDPTLTVNDGQPVGDCGVVGTVNVCYADAAETSESFTMPTSDEVVGKVYLPYDHGQDEGVNLNDFLDYWQKVGLPWGGKLAGHTESDYRDLDRVYAATNAFGCQYIGISVPAPMDQQATEGLLDLTGTADDRDIEGGHCLTPEARVLTRSLDWVPIGDLEEGDHLIAFDENRSGRGVRRRYKPAVVMASERLRLPCYDLEFEDGTVVTCAYDHLWLGERGAALEWMKTEDMIPGKHRVVKSFDTWERAETWEAGYLAGAFDGEGWVDKNGKHPFRMGFCQRDNEMLETTLHCLKEMGIEFAQYPHTSGFTDKPLTNLVVRSRADVAKLIGTARPPRLMANLRVQDLGAVQGNHANLVRKTFVGEREVVALQTDAGTYIAEGYASHNCVVILSRDSDVGNGQPGGELATWGMRVKYTDRWLKAYLEEAHCALTPSQVERKGNGYGLDLAALKADLAHV